MKILISPAKSLNYKDVIPFNEKTQPLFLAKAREIQTILQTLSPSDLGQLMHISDSLALLNWTRNQERLLEFNGNGEMYRSAIYAFDGDVYTGLDAYNLTVSQVNSLQHKLRILSGLYGLLKPLDQIEPYRVEMGTKIKIGANANLYEFWKETITKALNEEMTKGELLINLASKEYFTAIDKKKVIGTLVTPDFKELRNGKLKSISFFAKKARGMMVRYIVENEIETLEELKSFHSDGYRFSESDSTDTNLIFTR